MTILLAALILQATALPAETWKERNHPDMPRLPICNFRSKAHTNKIIDLPKEVSSELARFFKPAGGLSESNGPFNSTDVVDGRVPSRRFLRAYPIGSIWVVWYEHGGFSHNIQTIALVKQANDHSNGASLRVQGGTTFGGDLCAATKAIVAGVRTGTP